MKGFNYLAALEAVWKHAVELYKAGNRTPSEYFDAEQLEFLTENGLKIMDLYDAAEDFVSSGDPDFATFVAMSDVRRNYFLIEQKGVDADFEITPSDLPAKSDELSGISWLPRILPKARGKLQGTLSPEIMYCCGGDRRFFKVHDLHPAEFLQVVWQAGEDDAKVVDYILAKTVQV